MQGFATRCGMHAAGMPPAAAACDADDEEGSEDECRLLLLVLTGMPSKLRTRLRASRTSRTSSGSVRRRQKSPASGCFKRRRSAPAGDANRALLPHAQRVFHRVAAQGMSACVYVGEHACACTCVRVSAWISMPMCVVCQARRVKQCSVSRPTYQTGAETFARLCGRVHVGDACPASAPAAAGWQRHARRWNDIQTQHLFYAAGSVRAT